MKKIFLFATLNLLIFWIAFGFHPNNDTESFLDFISWFREPGFVHFYESRFLNPLYGVIGSTLFFFLPPVQSLILTNIIFYYCIVFATYDLIFRVFKDTRVAFMTVAFLVTAYAMVRYGLTQVQDVGGYAWYILCVYASWRWWESRAFVWLVLGGIATAFGMLTKETGAMGALFFGTLLLWMRQPLFERVKAFCIFSFFPFITLLINQWRGSWIGFSSADWYRLNWEWYAHDYTLFKFIGVHATSYHIITFLFAIGVYTLIKKRKSIPLEVWIYLTCIIPPSLTFFAWPSFISRTVFIAAWCIFPVAAYGLVQLYDKAGYWRYLAAGMGVVAIITPYILQSVIGYSHLFLLIEECNRKPACIWDGFIIQRETEGYGR